MLEFNESKWLRPDSKFNTHKKKEAEKNDDKDGRTLYKLMSNAVYDKIMENLINKTYKIYKIFRFTKYSSHIIS